MASGNFLSKKERLNPPQYRPLLQLQLFPSRWLVDSSFRSLKQAQHLRRPHPEWLGCPSCRKGMRWWLWTPESYFPSASNSSPVLPPYLRRRSAISFMLASNLGESRWFRVALTSGEVTFITLYESSGVLTLLLFAFHPHRWRQVFWLFHFG